jgi:rare lipoprotein A
MKNRFFALVASLFCLISFQAIAQETGYASYVSDEFNGSGTAYGEVYDRNKLTCAHKMHPLGTRLKVTRLDNGRSVIVRVNDKGPYIKGRIVDLSYAAAKQLDILRLGEVEVKIEVAGQETVAEAPKPTTVANTPTPNPATPPAPVPATSANTDNANALPSSPKPAPATPTVKPVSKVQPDKAKLVRDNFKANGLYKIALEESDNKGFGVQVASVASYEGMLAKVAELQGKWFDNILMKVEGGNRFKVILGPFPDQKAAESYEASLLKRYKIKGFVVPLADKK